MHQFPPDSVLTADEHQVERLEMNDGVKLKEKRNICSHKWHKTIKAAAFKGLCSAIDLFKEREKTGRELQITHSFIDLRWVRKREVHDTCVVCKGIICVFSC